MSDLFDLSNFDKYKEDNCREVKKAEGGLPATLWESYSSFANSNGGVIILGVGERQDGTWYTTGLKNADKLKRNFWNTIHNTKKVSINLLSDKNVESYEVNGDTIIVIYVPRAKRDQKPVYINNDLFGGSYRRDWEGDYHCSKAEIKGMLRDAADETEDMKIVMKMFNMIGIGERAGSGIPDIYQVWESEGWSMPVVEESYNPDRTRLSLEFTKKHLIKTNDKKQTIKTNGKKQTTKTEKHREKIREFLAQTELASARDIAEIIGLSAERTRVVLSKMDDIEPVGENRNRMYKLKK